MQNQNLKIIPLGGAGEIGKNMTIYEYDNQILIVDCGIMFPNDNMLGVDLVLPDWQYLMDKKEQVCGIVITHGHEDHIGALPFFLKDGFLDAPIYATPLARGLIESKFDEHRLLKDATLHTYQSGDVVRLGPYEIEPVRVSHSIPDSAALAIRTPVGMIVQTGDFKFDHTPVDGRRTDINRLAALGNEGVLMLLGDSTGVEKKGSTESEAIVAEALEKVFHETEGRLIITSFASQLQRVQQVLQIAQRHNRVVATVGRSMINYSRIARELGYLSVNDGTLVTIQEALQKQPHEVVILATGSQGEPRAALALMANESHRQISIEPGDTVVLSAGPIPGNEASVSHVIDKLFRLGANVIYDAIEQVHVSGHGRQNDIMLMQQLLKPRYVIPVHGEYRHLVLHGRLAARLGVPESNIFVVEDGQAILVSQEQEVTLGDRVPGGWVFVDGKTVGKTGAAVLRDREILSQDGFVVAVVTIDGMTDEAIGRPQLISRGFVYVRDSERLFERAEVCIMQVLEEHKFEMHDIHAIENKIRNALNRYFYNQTRRRPMILPSVQVV